MFVVNIAIDLNGYRLFGDVEVFPLLSAVVGKGAKHEKREPSEIILDFFFITCYDVSQTCLPLLLVNEVFQIKKNNKQTTNQLKNLQHSIMSSSDVYQL